MVYNRIHGRYKSAGLMNTIYRFRRSWIVLIFLPVASLLFIFSIERNGKSSNELESSPVAQFENDYAENNFINNEINMIQPNCNNPTVGEEEKTSVALLKVHKTGSTTLSSILYRYGVHRGLSFVMPTDPNLHQFFPQTMDEAFHQFYPPCKEKYDILNIHSRYNGREVLTKYMHRDTFVIATLRHPAEQMISGFKYYGYSDQLAKMNATLSDFLDNPKKYIQKMNNGANPMDLMWNGMSNDIGLSEFNIPKGLTMSQLKNDPEHMKSVERFLEWAESEIDFFLISEVFDESLILLKDMLNWKLEDLIYFSQNAAANKINDVDDDLRDKLIQFSYIDYLLYQKMFSKYFKLKAKNEYLEEQVLELQILNEEFSEFCLAKREIDPKLYGSVPILGNKLRIERQNNRCCYDTAVDEWTYVGVLKQYMEHSCTLSGHEPKLVKV